MGDKPVDSSPDSLGISSSAAKFLEYLGALRTVI